MTRCLYIWYHVLYTTPKTYVSMVRRLRYDTNPDLRREISDFWRDGRINRAENTALTRILDKNRRRKSEVLRRTTRSRLERLKRIAGLRASVRRKIDAVLRSWKTPSKKPSRSRLKKSARLSRTRVLSAAKARRAAIRIRKNVSRKNIIAIKNTLPGKQGTDTKLAHDVARFQKQNGMTVDGKPGPSFMNALGLSAWSSRWERKSASRTKESRESRRGGLTWRQARKALWVGTRCRIKSTRKWFRETWSSRALRRTCLDWLKPTTVEWAKVLMSKVKGTLIITGWTEKWHAGWRFSHRNGYKLDFASSRPLLRYLAKLRGTRGFPKNRPMTRTIGGYKMTFLRHNPDHVDVRFLKA